MPYRRLPNTDNARLKALNSALQKGKDLPPFKLAFQQGTLQKIHSVLPAYKTALSEHKNSYTLQISKSKDLNKSMKKVRLYITHFIQVINMAISRGELPLTTKTYFSLDNDDKKLPALNTEEEIARWAEILMAGEKNRIMEGKSPITNPTIAVVKVQYDKFNEARQNQNSLRKRYQRAQDQLNSVRDEVDLLIQKLWNEIENTFKDLPEDLKREKASDYGVVYVYRKNELGPINLLRTARVEIG